MDYQLELLVSVTVSYQGNGMRAYKHTCLLHIYIYIEVMVARNRSHGTWEPSESLCSSDDVFQGSTKWCYFSE